MAETVLSGILEELTIDEVRNLNPDTCVIPIGSTEPHGPALSYGTDSFNVQKVCYGGTKEANKLGGRVLCLPTIRISLNNNFRCFPFACRLSVPVFMKVLKDIVKMCHSDGADKIVIVNGHGGNTDVIKATLRDLAEKDSPFTCMLVPASCAPAELSKLWEHPSPHAGESETSRSLYTKPEFVRKDRITANPINEPKLKILSEFKAEFVKPWHLYMPTSAGGDSTKSSAEKGKIFIDACIQGLGKFLSELSKAEYDGNFPY